MTDNKEKIAELEEQLRILKAREAERSHERKLLGGDCSSPSRHVVVINCSMAVISRCWEPAEPAGSSGSYTGMCFADVDQLSRRAQRVADGPGNFYDKLPALPAPKSRAATIAAHTWGICAI